MVGTGGQRPKDLSPRGRYREESLREDDKVLSSRSSFPPRIIGVGISRVGEDGVGVVVRGAGCEERVRLAIVG
jgi:hypothetical protein